MTSLDSKLAERQEKHMAIKIKAAQLSRELNTLLQAKKDREAALEGRITEHNYTLYQTLYKFESDDSEDLPFEAGEILRSADS